MKVWMAFLLYLLVAIMVSFGFVVVKFRGKDREEYESICYVEEITLFGVIMFGLVWPLAIPCEIIYQIWMKLDTNKSKALDVLYKIVNIGAKKNGGNDKKSSSND